jgi:hypothetical protein
MTHEEPLILDFLGGSPETAFARKEIARKAVKRTLCEENPRRADRPQATLVASDLVKIEKSGLCRNRKMGYAG